MRSARTSAVERSAGVVSRRHIPWGLSYGDYAECAVQFVLRLILETKWPAIMAFLFGKIDPTVVPWIAISAIAGFHGDERCAGGIGRSVPEEGAGAGGGGLVLAAVEEGRDGGNAARFANLAEQGAAVARIITKSGASWRVGAEGRWSVLK